MRNAGLLKRYGTFLMDIEDKTQLIEHVNRGNQVAYLYFWGHRKPKAGVSRTCLSQWYVSPFVVAGIEYKTAEHYMMAEKARLFGDTETCARIVGAPDPGRAKARGRRVKGFDERTWALKRFEIVVRGNLQKFGQHRALGAFLLGTGDAVLVEASPMDRIWGVGLASDDPRIGNPNHWRGLNLLGFALMEVRAALRKQD